jgi:hypothetical protein
VEGDDEAAQTAAGGGERLAWAVERRRRGGGRRPGSGPRWEGRLPRAYESGGAHLKKAYCSLPIVPKACVDSRGTVTAWLWREAPGLRGRGCCAACCGELGLRGCTLAFHGTDIPEYDQFVELRTP